MLTLLVVLPERVRVLISEKLRLRRGAAALPRQLLGERGMDLSMPRRVGIPPQTAPAIAVVVPARVVEDWIEADAVDGDSLASGGCHLVGDVAEPAVAMAVLGAGLGDHQRPAVAFPRLAQDLPEGAVERFPPLDGRPIQNPLVVRVVVEADDIEIELVAAELRPKAAGDQVPPLKLGPPVPLGGGPHPGLPGVGLDVDRGIAMEDAGPRVDAPEGVDGRQGRPRELRLELEPAAGGAGVEVADLAAGPGPERDLVDRHVPGDVVRLGGDQPGHGAGVVRETVHEFGAEDVEAVRPAVVAEVPDHLQPALPRGPRQGEQRREVVAAARALYSVPAGAVAYGPHPEPAHPRVVLDGEAVMPRRGEQIEPPAVIAPVTGALETYHPETSKHPSFMPSRGARGARCGPRAGSVGRGVRPALPGRSPNLALRPPSPKKTKKLGRGLQGAVQELQGRPILEKAPE